MMEDIKFATKQAGEKLAAKSVDPANTISFSILRICGSPFMSLWVTQPSLIVF